MKRLEIKCDYCSRELTKQDSGYLKTNKMFRVSIQIELYNLNGEQSNQSIIDEKGDEANFTHKDICPECLKNNLEIILATTLEEKRERMKILSEELNADAPDTTTDSVQSKENGTSPNTNPVVSSDSQS